MKYFLLFAVLFCSITLFAQDRSKISVPPYELAKIKGLVSKMEHDEEENLKLPAKSYNALSLREKFTYHMIHAESYSQNCDAMPPIENEHKKIFGNLPDAFGEYSWSERQQDFLRGQRDSVMALIKESVLRSKRMGVNYKAAVVAMNSWEMIPFLISTYNTDKKDHDILTVLMLLMKQNEYKPFMTSTSFTKLYGEDADFRAYLDLNKANEDLILERAGNLYKSKK
ncbi:hypothetical protein GFS24_24825 [Chitinophaga sp. SYP-B3965]|uniref:hypothetical protein n=1 Tax=Chitinophaga sp. SYP-B3965 TaxID=2663120 RepID=UPI001299E0C4|nr:hypothetical protein [Chitinophaga sp. SYP-B3965]MRG48364.1 hypothetical protein [Chitinophaga sp. SYP-B3965]